MTAAGKYLSFRLAKEDFAIPVRSVHEVMGLQEIAPVSEAPEYVKGVMSRRGKVVPVLDLRLRLGLPGTPLGRKTCIVVVQVAAAGDFFLLGLLVDSVLAVMNVGRGEIRKPPECAPHLLGTVRLKRRLKVLLDADRMLPEGEVRGLRALAAG